MSNTDPTTKPTPGAALSADMSAAAQPADKPKNAGTRAARAATVVAAAAAAAAANAHPPAAPLAGDPNQTAADDGAAPERRLDPELDGDDADGPIQPVDYGGIGAEAQTGARPSGFAPPPLASLASQSRAARPKPGDVAADYDPSDDIETMETDAEVEAWIAENFGGTKPIFFGTTELKLYAPPRPGFYRHWFNDRPGRIASAVRAGYMHVLDDATKRPIERVVGVAAEGGGQRAYLMETPLKWHKEALRRGQLELDKIDADIMAGNVGRKEGDERYIPESGGRSAIQIKRE